MRLARGAQPKSGKEDFELGMALGHLQRWPEAREALLAGRRACPEQKQFPVELAGVAFQQKNYPEAAAWLRRALRLDAGDKYALDFAGTVYYLMGNLPAALKYWNRVEKPYVATVRFDEGLRVQRLVLDRAFAFAPAQVMKQGEFEATENRLRGLGLFPAYNIGLRAQSNAQFNAEFHGIERNGFGNGRVQALLSVFSGLPYETVYPSYYNIGRAAMNVDSLFRWDAEKRRAWIEVSAPLRKMPKRRWSLMADVRDENWSVRRSFTGTAPELGALHLRKGMLGGSVTAFQSGRFTWSTGGEISRRSYSHVREGAALSDSVLRDGWQAKSVSAVEYKLVDLPEHRLWLWTGANLEFARLWSQPADLNAKLQGSERLHWYPQATGDVYEVEQRLRAGKAAGTVPFDELWMLGVERDNDLWLRGLIGTRDGRKGSAPMGNGYLLANNTVYRKVYDNGLFGLHAGPWLDIGRMGAPTSGLSTQDWLVSAGGEAKLTVLGTGVLLTYGRDLRAGTNAFYATVAKQF